MKLPKTRIPSALAVSGLGLMLAGNAALADIISFTSVNDAMVWHREGNVGYTGANFGSTVDMDIYSFDANLNAYSYVQFDVSSLGPIVVNSATFNVTQIAGANPDNGLTGSTRNDTITTDRVAVYGLLDVAGNTAQNWDEATLTFDTTGEEIDTASVNGVSDPFNVGEGRSVDFSTLETLSGTTVNLTGATVVSFVQGRADSNGLITFMIDFVGTGSRGIGFNTSEAGANMPTLTLDYTVVPEPSIAALLVGLGALTLGLRRRRR